MHTQFAIGDGGGHVARRGHRQYDTEVAPAQPAVHALGVLAVTDESIGAAHNVGERDPHRGRLRGHLRLQARGVVRWDRERLRRACHAHGEVAVSISLRRARARRPVLVRQRRRRPVDAYVVPVGKGYYVREAWIGGAILTVQGPPIYDQSAIVVE